MTGPARFMLAAPRSGGGKTTVTCGLLRAFIRRGLAPAAFKCGPDYIDPLFHSEVLGAQTGNLDLFFTREETAAALLAREARGCDLAVLEGVMGYYDGLGGTSTRASSFHLARATGTPVVLVVDAGGASLSLCALIGGLMAFRPGSGIQGVLLNRCSRAQYELLRPVIEAECGVEVLGYLPADPRYALESRHLGLVTAAEVAHLREKLELLADTLSQTVDLDRLLELAQSAPALDAPALRVAPVTDRRPVIAVARDKAFCFYYRENLELLELLGAQVRFFSPLTDAALPAGACALYLGGGYPELYGKALEENWAMRAAVKAAVAGGMPTLAECGGFMYLHRSLTDQQGESLEMAGVIDGACRFTGSLRRFGYVCLTALEDNLLCRAGESIPAHEFHYFDSDACGGGFEAKKPLTGKGWPCVHAGQTLYAGFPHLYFHGNLAFAQRFVRAAEAFGGNYL